LNDNSEFDVAEQHNLEMEETLALGVDKDKTNNQCINHEALTPDDDPIPGSLRRTERNVPQATYICWFNDGKQII